jgi:hypothetical protein
MKRRTKLEIIKQVVEEKQYTKIRMHVGNKPKTVVLDYVTADKMLKLFNNAPLANIDKINALAWDRLVNMAWSPLNTEYTV